MNENETMNPSLEEAAVEESSVEEVTPPEEEKNEKEERAKENIYVGIALDLTVEKGSWRATAEWLGVQANGRCCSWELV